MDRKRISATVALAAVLLSPLGAFGQAMSHARAKRLQEAHDRRHHHKAKIVGSSVAGGAVTGALVGGPVGAVVGAGVGAGGGIIANKIRKHHGIKHKMRHGY
ncbi:hypothetical protein [Terriglobus aquaticus]|uniref:Glycine zipper domain-containing protein n=1 Tax=Terriglobus aquaticus TaxID=940139 RepID=A0ABW9KP35_9BACT|nr:hypothetical protein [Terriglobus aquaticus]